MVRLLGALGDHCPRLLHPPLDVRAVGGVGSSSPGRHLVLPRGHLGVMTRGGFESLQGLVEAWPRLYGAVVAGSVCWVEFSFTVV